MKIRLANYPDLTNGLLETLNELAPTTELTLESAKEILGDSPNRYLFVAEECGLVVGTGSIFLERKLVHNGGWVGHIEDVVVQKEYRGMGIGEAIIKELCSVAVAYNAYKVILNCSEVNVSFYQKCGFYVSSAGMRKDIKGIECQRININA